MDYDFEAPTYVNFAEAMDEDESDVSRYFDVEHEVSFSRGKGTPGVVLPGGPRASSAKKGSENLPSASPRRSSASTKRQQTPSTSGRKSRTPAKRRSSGRQRTSTAKTPLKQKTPVSVKRLGQAKPLITTPGKVAAAMTALKLTPALKVSALGSGKRSRNEATEHAEASPSKRAKLTPKVAVGTPSNMEVSPPSMNMDKLLQQAIRTFNGSARKVKFDHTGQLVSTIDGIQVPCIPEKEHQMETRADKAAREPPIQLRSRSISKSSSRNEDESLKVHRASRIRSVSSDRQNEGSRGTVSRGRSIDRLLIPTEATKATQPFVSLAEATIRFQNRTPLRFRVKRHNSPAVKVKGPVLALRATIPQSPALRVKHRNRPINALSREEQEALELEEIRKNKFKPLPLPEKILKTVNPVPKVEKKPPTLPEPFNITEVKKKEINLSSEPVKFTARPAPKKIFEGPVGIAEKKPAPLTEPKSPSFCANALKKSKEAHKRITPVKHFNKITMKVLEERSGVHFVKEKQVCHLGVPSTVQTVKTTTEVKPFSFEERDRERIQRKEEKLRELQNQLFKKTTFHANPLPSFKTPPHVGRSVSPATRSRTPSALTSSKSNNPGQKNCGNIPETKAALIPHFKARVPTVLHRKPFEPVKPHRQLPLPDVTLASEIRAKDREAYDRQLMEREQELEAARQMLKAEKEMKEKEEVAMLRKMVVHKPNPVPKAKPFEPQPSNKPLTDPNTPFCLKRSRKLSAA